MANKKKKYNARFPPARIKKIMQKDDNVGKVAVTVPLIISRSLELFIEKLITKSYNITLSKKAKTLSIHHLKQVIHADNNCNFLDEILSKIPDFENTEIEPPAVISLNKEETSILNSYQNFAKTNSTSFNIGNESMKTSKNNSKNHSAAISEVLKDDCHKKDTLYGNMISKVHDSKVNNCASLDNKKNKKLNAPNDKRNNEPNLLSTMSTNNEQCVEKVNSIINNLASNNNEKSSIKLPVICDHQHESDNEALDLTNSSKKIRKKKSNGKEKSDKKIIVTKTYQTSGSTVPFSLNIPSFTNFLNDVNETEILPNDKLIPNTASKNSYNSHFITQFGQNTQKIITENYSKSPFISLDFNSYASISQKNIADFEAANVAAHNSVLQGLNKSTGLNEPYLHGMMPYFSNPMVPICSPIYPQAPTLMHNSAMLHNSEHLNNRYIDINLNKISDKPSEVVKSKKK